jgi:predicted DsbA family dithiol-disulfide isomerase
MADRTECCRYEPSLNELIDDDMMQPVLQSAGLDRERFHDLMVETGDRIRLSREADGE